MAALTAVGTAMPATAQDAPGDDPEAGEDPRPSETPGRGEFMTEGQNLTGKFMHAVIGPQLVMVYDYQVGGTPYFRSIRAPDAFEVETQGGNAWLTGDGFELQIVDTPSGFVKFIGGPFVVEPAANASFEQQSHGAALVQAADGTGTVTGAHVQGGVLHVTDGFMLLHGPTAARVANGADASTKALFAAVADGRVAAMIDVSTEGIDVYPFGQVHVEARAMDGGRYQFLVDDKTPGPNAVVADFAQGTMRADRVSVRFFETIYNVLEPASLQPADSLEDALETGPDEVSAEYFLINDGSAVRVVLALPEDGVKAFEVRGTGSQGLASVPPVTYGLIAGILLATAAGLWLLMPHRPGAGTRR